MPDMGRIHTIRMGYKMKRWVFLAVLLLSGSAYAGFADSSAKMIATTIYEQLDRKSVV